MAKDHYVAQTYLRAFGLEDNSDLVNVVRKSNLSRQNAIPIKSICYGVDWSTTEYIPDNPRAVEDYLKLFEPKWAECVKSIYHNNEVPDGRISILFKSLYSNGCAARVVSSF